MSGSHLPQKFSFLYFNKGPFKMIKNSLFHLKSTFRSEDISIFLLAFFSHVGNGLTKKLRLLSKFMTSHTGKK